MKKLINELKKMFQKKKPYRQGIQSSELSKVDLERWLYEEDAKWSDYYNDLM